MTRKEYEEVKGIALEMKARGQTKVIMATPRLAVEGPSKGVTIVESSS